MTVHSGRIPSGSDTNKAPCGMRCAAVNMAQTPRPTETPLELTCASEVGLESVFLKHELVILVLNVRQIEVRLSD